MAVSSTAQYGLPFIFLTSLQTCSIAARRLQDQAQRLQRARPTTGLTPHTHTPHRRSAASLDQLKNSEPFTIFSGGSSLGCPKSFPTFSVPGLSHPSFPGWRREPFIYLFPPSYVFALPPERSSCRGLPLKSFILGCWLVKLYISPLPARAVEIDFGLDL